MSEGVAFPGQVEPRIRRQESAGGVDQYERETYGDQILHGKEQLFFESSAGFG